MTEQHANGGRPAANGPQAAVETKTTVILSLIAVVLIAAIAAGWVAGNFWAHGDRQGIFLSLFFLPVIPLVAYFLYKTVIIPSYRRLEDANLELLIKREELLDTKDDLFIKFLGIYDVNYAANSPRLFHERLKDVADITARVMGADVCLIYQYVKKRDELTLAATNGYRQEAVGLVTIPLGQGIEGWTARRIEPVMLRDFIPDPRFRDVPGLALASYASLYCLPLYVYSSGALMGVIELLYAKARNFSDEEINFFTTLSGILSNTIQNELLQTELRKMNVELEQWVAEKTEELRASEERYRTVVENANESIFVLAESGDVVFANQHAVRLTGHAKFDLVHKNVLDFFTEGEGLRGMLTEAAQGGQSLRHALLRRTDGIEVPVEVSCVALTLMNKRFIQVFVRDISAYARLERRLEEKEREVTELRARLSVPPQTA